MKYAILILLTLAVLLGGCHRGSDVGSLDAQEDEPPMDVTEYVQQTYIEGIPYAEAASMFDADDVPALQSMLADPSHEAHWANAVTVLGIIGTDEAVETMIDFVEDGAEADDVSEAEYRAKTSAVMSLGYAVNRTGSEQALEYLKSWIAPAARTESMVAWQSPFHEAAEDRDAQLAKMAILGLALSGTPEAAQALRSLREEPAEIDEQRQFLAEVDTMLGEALLAHQKIADEGLVEYYEDDQMP